MTKTKGPTTTVKHSCLDCEYCKSERGVWEDDESYRYQCCTHKSFKEEKPIGYNYNTPKWCPFLKDK
jgi:hypothetical protein